MKLVDFKIKYDHSAEYNELNSYENEFKNVENNLRYDDPKLKDTILDKSFTYANIAVLDMIDNFKNNFSSMFVKEHDMNAYTYYDKKNKKMMYDCFKLYDKNNNEVDYTDIFDEDTLKRTKNVVSVIYIMGKYFGENPKNKYEYDNLYDKYDCEMSSDYGIEMENYEKTRMFIADHKHEEDNTFGFPSTFNSVPGGRRDSSNPLSTFFNEAHEELILGNKGIEFFDNSSITGYQLNENGALFIFCNVNRDATVNNIDENIVHSGFKPFSLTVYKNHEEFLKLEKELSKDLLKEYKKENSFKVLIPREQGKFDSVESSFRNVSFDDETLFGIPGRLNCYKKGSIIYEGLYLIKNL